MLEQEKVYKPFITNEPDRGWERGLNMIFDVTEGQSFLNGKPHGFLGLWLYRWRGR